MNEFQQRIIEANRRVFFKEPAPLDIANSMGVFHHMEREAAPFMINTDSIKDFHIKSVLEQVQGTFRQIRIDRLFGRI